MGEIKNMVTEHNRYKMQQHSKEDKRQTRFDMAGKLKQPVPQITIGATVIDYTQRVMCPFCLHADKLQAFLTAGTPKSPYSRAVCPECKNGMRMSSLTSEWTPEQYAEFVYPYAGSGFWQKCKFSIWKKRLAQIGWTQRFWDRYKQLKGEDTTESYIDYIERKSQEDQYEYEAQQHEE
jgi:hypothetical protein